jgi:hypothetical protein
MFHSLWTTEERIGLADEKELKVYLMGSTSWRVKGLSITRGGARRSGPDTSFARSVSLTSTCEPPKVPQSIQMNPFSAGIDQRDRIFSLLIHRPWYLSLTLFASPVLLITIYLLQGVRHTWINLQVTRIWMKNETTLINSHFIDSRLGKSLNH